MNHNGIPLITEVLSKTEIESAMFWLNSLGEDWRGDVPYALHERGAYGLGSAPPYAEKFVRYIGHLECANADCEQCRKERAKTRHRTNNQTRLRATKAFRRLRKISPREFDALYLYCILRYDVAAISKALTERAIKLDKPERYDANAVWFLLLGGIDKVKKFW